MSKNKTWSSPGWPWELDILAFVFVVIALLVPFLIYHENTSAAGVSNPAALRLKEQTYILWSIGIGVLYVMHIAVASASLGNISTPFIHLISPLGFALLGYYRIYEVSADMGSITMINGETGQVVAASAAVIFITLVVAKLRMARLMHRFRDVQWDLVCPSSYDRSYFELMTQFRPLVYPPRRYRASEQGLLVEGWFYCIVVPFESVQTINPIRTMAITTAGNYYASNTSSLVRFELLDNDRPLYISPGNRDEFIQYCARHVVRSRPSATHHNRQGTYPGVTARGTAPGLTDHGTNNGAARATHT